MNFRSYSPAALCLLFAGLTLNPAPRALAQKDAGQPQSPSKYLFLTNVELKPGQGDAYADLEGQEVQALRAAGAPTHYFALWSITGSGTHVLYFHGFESFADLQKDHEATVAMTKLEDTIKADNAQEAPLVAERHSSVYSWEKDLSAGGPIDLSKMRFMRILLIHVRSGHDEDFRHVAKTFVKDYAAIPEAHWAMFQKMFGTGSDNTYILCTPLESLSGVDDMMNGDKKFGEAVGDDHFALLMKGLDVSVESSEEDLYAFGNKISYVPDSWVSSSPDFWGKK